MAMRATADRSGRNDDRSGDAVRPRIAGRRGGEIAVVALPFGTLFEGSNDRYYTDWQVRQRLRTGAWALCMRQRAPDRWLVETEAAALLSLSPIEQAELPTGLEIRVVDDRARVVDPRDRSPATGLDLRRPAIDRNETAPTER